MALTFPIGFMRGGAAAGGPSCSYIGRNASSANQSSYSFPGQSIGPSAGLIVVAALSDSNSNAFNSLTIGGVAATLLTSTTGSFAAALYALSVAAGGTATINVALAGTANNLDIEVFSLTGLSSTTPTDADAARASDGPISVGLTTSAGGCVLAASAWGHAAGTTWSGGVTEDADSIVEGYMTFSAAHANGLSAGTTTPQASFSSGVFSGAYIVAAAFR